MTPFRVDLPVCVEPVPKGSRLGDLVLESGFGPDGRIDHVFIDLDRFDPCRPTEIGSYRVHYSRNWPSSELPDPSWGLRIYLEVIVTFSPPLSFDVVGDDLPEGCSEDDLPPDHEWIENVVFCWAEDGSFLGTMLEPMVVDVAQADQDDLENADDMPIDES